MRHDELVAGGQCRTAEELIEGAVCWALSGIGAALLLLIVVACLSGCVSGWRHGAAGVVEDSTGARGTPAGG